MERSFILLEICGRKSVAYYHISLFFQNFLCHFPAISCRISIVSVYHNITLRINFPEHPSDHVSLALLMFISNYSSCLAGNLDCSICRVIIVNVNHCFWKSLFPVLHNFSNCLGFIVARNQNSNLIQSYYPPSDIFYMMCILA